MPKYKERKLRGKVRQQVRWAIDDQSLWESEIFTQDIFTIAMPEDDGDEPIRPRTKIKRFKPKYDNTDFID